MYTGRNYSTVILCLDRLLDKPRTQAFQDLIVIYDRNRHFLCFGVSLLDSIFVLFGLRFIFLCFMSSSILESGILICIIGSNGVKLGVDWILPKFGVALRRGAVSGFL